MSSSSSSFPDTYSFLLKSISMGDIGVLEEFKYSEDLAPFAGQILHQIFMAAQFVKEETVAKIFSLVFPEILKLLKFNTANIEKRNEEGCNVLHFLVSLKPINTFDNIDKFIKAIPTSLAAKLFRQVNNKGESCVEYLSRCAQEDQEKILSLFDELNKHGILHYNQSLSKEHIEPFLSSEDKELNVNLKLGLEATIASRGVYTKCFNHPTCDEKNREKFLDLDNQFSFDLRANFYSLPKQIKSKKLHTILEASTHYNLSHLFREGVCSDYATFTYRWLCSRGISAAIYRVVNGDHRFTIIKGNNNATSVIVDGWSGAPKPQQIAHYSAFKTVEFNSRTLYLVTEFNPICHQIELVNDASDFAPDLEKEKISNEELIYFLLCLEDPEYLMMGLQYNLKFHTQLNKKKEELDTAAVELFKQMDEASFKRFSTVTSNNENSFCPSFFPKAHDFLKRCNESSEVKQSIATVTNKS